MTALGIDLGTTFSVAAYLDPQGRPALCPDALDASRFSTPSVVYVGPEGTLVGQPAEELLEDTPALPVARHFKASLGDPAWHHQDGTGRRWSAAGLAGLLLRKLARDAQTTHPGPTGPVVVTVPAQFNDLQRRDVLRAAQLAGLGTVGLADEPVAAALFHGLSTGADDRTVMVFDFGGGTFDVTILHNGEAEMQVLATDGIADLGGRDVDAAIAMQFAGPVAKLDAGTAQRLRRVAERAKVKLAQQGGLPVFRQALLLGEGIVDCVLTRAQLQAVCTPLVARAIACCERCLREAGLSWRDIDRIVLTGGSSLLPDVAPALLAASGKAQTALVTRHPQLAVGYGAALLAGREQVMERPIRQVSRGDLGVRVRDPRSGALGVDVLVPRNTRLPASCTRSLYTERDNQNRVVLEFVHRTGEPAVEVSLGYFAFGPLPNPRANQRIDVTATLGADGVLQVRAQSHDGSLSLNRSLAQDSATPGGIDSDEAERVAGARINP